MGLLDEETALVAARFLDEYPALDPGAVVDAQALRVRLALRDTFGDRFEVFFAPSGSDLTYWPLVFQSMLYGDRPLVNVVSCWDEIGTGSRLAAQGWFHTRINQFGEPVPKHHLVSEHCAPNVWTMDARDHRGEVMVCTDLVTEQVRRARGSAVVASITFGSKTGLKDDLQVVTSGREDNVLWSVDLCQLRLDKDFVGAVVDQGGVVMVTGSKFFQAPPFCGALLVPNDLCDRLRDAPTDMVAEFDQIFAAPDVPATLPAMRERLRSRENLGLRARWEVALHQMERHRDLHTDRVSEVTRRWRDGVASCIDASTRLRIAPGWPDGIPSILSFHVLRNGIPLNLPELRKLYALVVQGRHEGFSSGFDRVSVGQPVGTEAAPYLRVALGARSVHDMVSRDVVDLDDDIRLLEVISEAAH